MKIFIGADHKGYALKERLVKYLKRAGYEVEDKGDTELNPEDDFPYFAAKVANSVVAPEDGDARGILICGSGQGMAMAANRFKGVRAALCWDRQSAREARNDDDSNVLCLPAQQVEQHEAEVIAETWLNTRFAGAARFQRRIEEIDRLN
jgi:ribose 5-phosphate isomerase B